MTDIPTGIDNPSGFNPDSKTFKPTAFIKDPGTMDYLRKQWQFYSISQERKYPVRPDFDYRKDDPRNHAFINEQFGKDLRAPQYNFGTQKFEADYRYTLVNQEVRGLFKESAARVHSVNFFDEIQRNLDRRRAEGNTKPVHILVAGSDLGFFNDELRARFGNAVNVVGTTVEVSRSNIRKHQFYELIRTGRLRRQIPKELQEYLVAALKPTIDKRDSKWRSILQMESADPEFDMIIDTGGELPYSYFPEKPEIFELTFQACIQKLNPGGKLYIAQLDYFDARRFVVDYYQKHGLELERHTYDDRHGDPNENYIITKPV